MWRFKGSRALNKMLNIVETLFLVSLFFKKNFMAPFYGKLFQGYRATTRRQSRLAVITIFA